METVKTMKQVFSQLTDENKISLLFAAKVLKELDIKNQSQIIKQLKDNQNFNTELEEM